jgi:hypothetical protein
MRKFEDSGLVCPITNEPLFYVSTKEHIMDPDSFYCTKDKTIVYANHPFDRFCFRQIDPTDIGRTCSKELRIFYLQNDNTWVEHIKIQGTDINVPITTSKEEIERIYNEYVQNKKNREEQYNKDVAEGKIIPFPGLKRVHPINIPFSDLIEVKSMSPPSGEIYYFDFKYKGQQSWSQRTWNKIKKLIKK